MRSGRQSHGRDEVVGKTADTLLPPLGFRAKRRQVRPFYIDNKDRRRKYRTEQKADAFLLSAPNITPAVGER
jgi:hypothetical protein